LGRSGLEIGIAASPFEFGFGTCAQAEILLIESATADKGDVLFEKEYGTQEHEQQVSQIMPFFVGRRIANSNFQITLCFIPCSFGTSYVEPHSFGREQGQSKV
jgi:hypothetical protein